MRPARSQSMPCQTAISTTKSIMMALTGKKPSARLAMPPYRPKNSTRPITAEMA